MWFYYAEATPAVSSLPKSCHLILIQRHVVKFRFCKLFFQSKKHRYTGCSTLICLKCAEWEVSDRMYLDMISGSKATVVMVWYGIELAKIRLWKTCWKLFSYICYEKLRNFLQLLTFSSAKRSWPDETWSSFCRTSYQTLRGLWLKLFSQVIQKSVLQRRYSGI